MGKNLLMVITSILVVGAMAFILLRFLRRLRKIEKERWGDKA